MKSCSFIPLKERGKRMKELFTGGCQCQQVRYTLYEHPLRLIACHCTECQMQSGSAFGLSLHIKESTIQLIGSLKSFSWVSDSGRLNSGFFCPDCGNRIYNNPERLNGIITLKPGTLDNTSWLYPESFQWMKSAQDWIVVPENMKIWSRQNS